MHYLKIFSWFLFTFGLVGLIAVAFGLSPGIGSVLATMGALATQVVFSSIILYGFKLNQNGKLNRKALVYGGWLLIVLLIVIAGGRYRHYRF